jgi:hypothetical protein
MLPSVLVTMQEEAQKTMLRSAGSKALWVLKGSALFGGAVVTLALVLGMASMAFGANGGNFILGQNNSASLLTKLTGNVNGSAMQVVNNNADANDTALNLSVQSGEAPMRVNSATKVTSLNADQLDGKDASTIGRELWAVVGSNGNLVRGNGVVGAGHLGQTGAYVVQFNRSVSGCAYTATTSNGSAGPTGVDEGTDHPGFLAQQVIVFTVSTNGTNADLPFHLIVAC